MLAESHSKKSKADRKAKRIKVGAIANGVPTFTEAYNKADKLVDAVYKDIAKGVSRSVIIDKIKKGSYKCMEKPLAARTAATYYTAALDRFAVDTDIEAEKLRTMFYGRYEKLLNEAVAKGDIFNARGILDSMSKIFLGVKENQTNIQVNALKDGISINFGFNNDNEDNNVNDDKNDIQEAEIIDDK